MNTVDDAQMVTDIVSVSWSLQDVEPNKDTETGGLKKLQTFFLSVDFDSEWRETKKKRTEEESSGGESYWEHNNLSL